MKFNLNSRNIAIAILLILTLILGIVSIIIATRLGQSTNNTVSTAVDVHGCNLDKNEYWCEATQQCIDPTMGSCSSTPPSGGTCQTSYAGGCITRSGDCTTGVSCTRHTGANDSPTCSDGNDTFTLNPGQTVCVHPACQKCEQIDCGGDTPGGQRRNNDNQCTTNPPTNPPTSPGVCGDAKCNTGEVCERTASSASSFKNCTAADITAERAPTGTSVDSCDMSSCLVTAVITPPETPVSVPVLPTTGIGDDMSELMAGFALVVLGLIAYRFNVFGRLFTSLNYISSDSATKHSPLSRMLKHNRNSFERKVEKDFEKER